MDNQEEIEQLRKLFVSGTIGEEEYYRRLSYLSIYVCDEDNYNEEELFAAIARNKRRKVFSAPVHTVDSGQAEQWNTKGNDALKSNKLQEALEYYTKAIETDKTQACYWTNRSLVHGLLKNWELALVDADTAILKEKNWVKAYLRKGEALRELNRFHEAQDALNQGLKIEPDNSPLVKALQALAIIWKTKGNTSLKNEKYEEALLYYSKAIESHSSEPAYWTNRSFAHAKLKNWEPSLGDAETAISKDPKWVKGYLRKGEALRGLKRFDEAKKAYSEGLQIAPGDNLLLEGLTLVGKENETLAKEVAEQWKTKGNDALKENKLQEALDYYTKAIESDPSNAVYYTNRSLVQGLLNNWEQSLSDAEAALERNYCWTKAYLRKGEALRELKRYIEAHDAFNQGLALEPTNESLLKGLESLANKWKTKGNDALKYNKFEDALLYYSKAIEIHPSKSVYWTNRSFVHGKLKNWEQALIDAETAIEKDPNWEKGYLRKGEALRELKQYYKAREAFNQGLKLSPGNELLLEALGSVLPYFSPERQNDKETSNPKESETKEHIPSTSDADHWKTKGNEAMKKNDFQEAFNNYSKAIEIDPSNPSYWTNRSTVYGKLKNWEKSLSDANTAIQMDPKWTKGYLRKIQALRALGRLEEAKEAFDEGLKLFPGNDSLISGLKGMLAPIGTVLPEAEQSKTKGNEALKAQKFTEAISHYSRAIEIDPSNSIYWTNRSHAYGLIQNWEKSLEDAHMALLKDPSWIKGHSRKAEALRKLKRYNEARETLEQGLSIDPKNEALLKDLKELSVFAKREEAETWRVKGNDAMKSNNLQNAIDFYSKAIESDPSVATYWSNRSLVYGMLKKWEESLADAEMAIVKDPNWIKGHLRKGEALRELGKFDLAKEALSQGLKIEPNNDLLKKALESIYQQSPQQFQPNPQDEAEKWKTKGNNSLKANNLPEALEFYSKAISLYPSAAYYTNRAYVYGLMKNWSQVLVDAEAALQKDPRWVKGYVRKAEALRELQRAMEANEVIRKGLEVVPGDEVLLQELKKVERK